MRKIQVATTKGTLLENVYEINNKYTFSIYLPIFMQRFIEHKRINL